MAPGTASAQLGCGGNAGRACGVLVQFMFNHVCMVRSPCCQVLPILPPCCWSSTCTNDPPAWPSGRSSLPDPSIAQALHEPEQPTPHLPMAMLLAPCPSSHRGPTGFCQNTHVHTHNHTSYSVVRSAVWNGSKMNISNLRPGTLTPPMAGMFLLAMWYTAAVRRWSAAALSHGSAK